MPSVNVGSTYLNSKQEELILKSVRVNYFGNNRYSFQNSYGQMEDEIGDKEIESKVQVFFYFSNAVDLSIKILRSAHFLQALLPMWYALLLLHAHQGNIHCKQIRVSNFKV